jgi:hypothetical protein
MSEGASKVRLDFRRVLLLGILAFVLHNGEEALTMPSWLESQFPDLIRQLGLRDIQPPTSERLYVGLLVVTIVPGLAVLIGAQGGAGSPGVYGCLFLYGILFWNALVPHVTSAILLRSYTPGLASAALVNLPYTVYLFGRAVRDGQATRWGIALVLGVAAVLYPLGMLLLWAPRSHG